MVFGLSLFGIFAVIVCLICFAVAKTGIVRIPFFSRVYHGPQPSRVVSYAPLSANDFNTLLTQRFSAQVAQKNGPPYSVSMTEQEISGALQSELVAATHDQAWNVVSSQVAIHPTEIEFYGQIVRGMWHIDARIGVVPRLQNGTLMFEPVSFQIGDYSLPPKFGIQMLDTIFSRNVDLSFAFGNIFVQDTRLSDGSLTLVASPQTP